MADKDGHQVLAEATKAQELLEVSKIKNSGSKLLQVSVKTTDLLDNLKSTLGTLGDLKRSAQHRESINKLQTEAKLPRFVVGVLGDTGAGKSTLINAILDEECIVPTNCMRACTAAVTEILWNPSNDPGKKYTAEIEFLTHEEWTQELIEFHRDIIDENGKIDEDTRNQTSIAGTAYTVIRSVYPTLTDAELERTHPTALASRPDVRQVLGKTIKVEEETCGVFYDKIQSYVDSVDHRKPRGASNDQAQASSKDDSYNSSMAYWPLVKVVRIFLKSRVLSTGVVLVDLPGSRDSNTARAAVAEKYVKECTRLWVVAPISRAVNDRTAKDLLGKHFKRQLKFDGAYSNITFVCTKADDIRLAEAAKNLGIHDTIEEMQVHWKEMKPEIDGMKTSVKKLEAHKSSLETDLGVVRTEIVTWKSLEISVRNNERTFAPSESPRKRKLQTTDEPRKKTKKDDVYSGTEDDSSDESDDDMPSQEEDQRQPLTMETVKAKIEELKDAKNGLKDEKKQVSRQISAMKASISALETQRSDLKSEMYRMCIQGRNSYSRAEIQKDFAFGLKELDEEFLAGQSQEEQQQHDARTATEYEKMGRELPVYCISSRAYQQLRTKENNTDEHFASIEETEVPALQKHTLDAAAVVQDSYIKNHLNEVCRFLRSIDLFLAGDDAVLNMSDAEREEECKYLKKGLDKLQTTLEESVTDCMTDCEETAMKILKRLPKAAGKASNEAPATVKSWGVSRDDGGLRYHTYKATCRRNGVFKGAAGPRDFNEGPMKNVTAESWDQTFSKKFPAHLDRLAVTCGSLISAFQGRMKGRRFLAENTDLVQSILTKHVASLKESQIHMTKALKKFTREQQRGANRELYPAIVEALRDTYSECAEVRGNGAFIVMKDLMEEEIENKRATMFHEAANDADTAVHNLLEGLEDMANQNVERVIETLEQDYTGLIGTVATEADKRDRKILAPIMKDFYQQLLLNLSESQGDNEN